jgi:hypothetical protein
MWEQLAPFAAGALGGISSWFVTQLLAEPLRRFFGMRRDIAQRLLVYRNIKGPPVANGNVTTFLNARDEARLREAKDKLRELATQTLSFTQTDSVATKLLQWRWPWRYNLQEAGLSLLALSLEIGRTDEKELTIYRNNVEAALDLKPIGVRSATFSPPSSAR